VIVGTNIHQNNTVVHLANISVPQWGQLILISLGCSDEGISNSFVNKLKMVLNERNNLGI
jgi:hypothetical protein